MPKTAQLVELLIGLVVENGRAERGEIQEHPLEERRMPGRRMESAFEGLRDVPEGVFESGVEAMESVRDDDQPILLLGLD